LISRIKAALPIRISQARAPVLHSLGEQYAQHSFFGLRF